MQLQSGFEKFNENFDKQYISENIAIRFMMAGSEEVNLQWWNRGYASLQLQCGFEKFNEYFDKR